jgi:hypothetical protein
MLRWPAGRSGGRRSVKGWLAGNERKGLAVSKLEPGRRMTQGRTPTQGTVRVGRAGGAGQDLKEGPRDVEGTGLGAAGPLT